ncbi:hypothetical protein Ga0074812_10355 [Parafrankia irregularis]|uniref:Uncharacterized protein n=1 Tax=Parafrankia irregularis TaxID=795642 RepID=A0A0S4QG89_9ACTN|nr:MULTISPECIES: hypothetical protein [Parafrankia]MBE3201035.1 hypothetical protein [Parafrankia sp. CH37]CUU54565.1 hypothetical protein Ga0074812_10355 [Parafrankia irregularis]
MRRWVSVAVTGMVIGCSVACAGQGSGDGGAGTDGAAARAVDGPVDRGTLGDVCDGDVALTGAPPYAGPGPHPVTVFSQPQGNDPTGPKLSIRLLADTDQQERAAFGAPIARTQLVACAERDRRKPTDIICRFDIGAVDEVPFFRTSYLITVREAHTGAVVATLPVDPAAAGCPTSVKVAWAGAEVFSAPTDRQLVSALAPLTSWDGAGSPARAGGQEDAPAPAGTAAGSAGSVQLTIAAGVDPNSPVLRDHLAFWAAFTGIQESDRPDLRALQARVDSSFMSSLMSLVDLLRGDAGRSTRGPVHLLVTSVSEQGGSIAVDSCVDETAREKLRLAVPTGEVGIRSRVRVTLVPGRDGYLATGFADAPPAACPAPAGRIG